MKRRNFLSALLALPFLRFGKVVPPPTATADLFALGLRLTESQAIPDAKRGGWGKSKHRV